MFFFPSVIIDFTFQISDMQEKQNKIFSLTCEYFKTILCTGLEYYDESPFLQLSHTWRSTIINVSYNKICFNLCRTFHQPPCSQSAHTSPDSSTNQRCPRGSARRGRALSSAAEIPLRPISAWQLTGNVKHSPPSTNQRWGGGGFCPPISHVTLLSSSQAVRSASRRWVKTPRNVTLYGAMGRERRVFREMSVYLNCLCARYVDNARFYPVKTKLRVSACC